MASKGKIDLRNYPNIAEQFREEFRWKKYQFIPSYTDIEFDESFRGELRQMDKHAAEPGNTYGNLLAMMVENALDMYRRGFFDGKKYDTITRKDKTDE